jgi:hypothetical protein
MAAFRRTTGVAMIAAGALVLVADVFVLVTIMTRAYTLGAGASAWRAMGIAFAIGVLLVWRGLASLRRPRRAS